MPSLSGFIEAATPIGKYMIMFSPFVPCVSLTLPLVVLVQITARGSCRKRGRKRGSRLGVRKSRLGYRIPYHIRQSIRILEDCCLSLLFYDVRIQNDTFSAPKGE